ncbi:TPA: DUF551 domain-containing protein [Klebsiella pneumoniae]
MTKSTITRERIQRIIRAIDSEAYDEEEIREWLSSDEIMELSSMALAAMDSEPDCKERKLFCSTDTARMRKVISVSAGTDVAPLYRHAQPVPRVPNGYVMVPVKPTREILDEFDSIIDYGAEDSEDAWRRLLAAAPQSPGSDPATAPGKWIPVSEQMPPSRHEVLVGRWWGEKPRWCCKWATYIPDHPDAQSSGWLIPGASWTPTHWMPLPAGPQEPKP